MTFCAPAALSDYNAVYVRWRRYLEDYHLRFVREPEGHYCWHEGSTPLYQDAAAGFYGCVVCGRAHVCRPPYASCPRETPLHATHKVCGFSGRVLESADDFMVPGHFEEEQRLEQAPFEADSIDAPVRTTHAYSLAAKRTREANTTSRSNKRARLLGQADEARERRQGFDDIQAYERATRRAVSATAAHAQDGFLRQSVTPPHDSPRDTRVEAFTAADGAEDADRDRDRDEPWAFAAHGPAIALGAGHHLELARDDQYLGHYLREAVRYIEDKGAVAFRPVRAPPPVPSVAVLTRLKSNFRAARVLPWPRLARSRTATAHDLLPHQQWLLHRITRHVQTQQQQQQQHPPLPISEYLLRVDRVLLLFNRFAPADETVPVDKQALVEGAADLLLGDVFTSDFWLRDHTDTQMPVWLADPFLKSVAARDTKSRHGARYLAVLRAANLSPQRLAHLIHDD